MNDINCVFCNYKSSDRIICQSNNCFSIISNNPINKFHIMVIPFSHYTNLIDIPDEIITDLFQMTKVLSASLRKICNPDAITHLTDDDINSSGFNIISHFKIHIIPRYKKDQYQIDWSKLRNKETDESLVEYTNCIKKEIKNNFV